MTVARVEPLVASARNTFDIVVLGGGIAATVAAKKCVEAGKRVGLVRAGGGATVHSSGAFDVATPRIPPRGQELAPPSLRDLVAEVLRRDPHHPYALVAAGDPGAVIGLIEEAREDLFADLLAEGLPYRGSLARNLWLATPGGRVKESAFAQETIAAGDLLALAKVRVAVVAVGPRAEEEAKARASSLRAELDRRGFFGVRDLTPVPVPEAPEGAGRARDEVSIAAALDDERAARDWAERVADAVDAQAHKATHVLFPPILGLREPARAAAAARAALEREVLETVAVPPSVPGLRLERALARMLDRKGVTSFAGRAVRVEAVPGAVRRVAVLARDGTIEAIEGKVFILASGRFLGGGIRLGNALAEGLFDLPLFYRGKPVERLRREEWFERHVVSAHPALSFGVRCDAELRPEGRDGGPAFENLFAAGSVLAGGSFVGDRSGLGVSLATGYVAGMNAAEAC